MFLLSLACGGLATEGDPPVEVEVPIDEPAEPEAPAEPDETVVLEGFLKYTTLDALRAAHGDAVGTVSILENEVGDIDYPALHPDTPEEVVFQFVEGIESVTLQIRHPESTRVSSTGMRIGATVEDVERMNGGPFTLSPTPEGIQAYGLDGGVFAERSITPFFGHDGDLYVDIPGAEQVEGAWTSDDPAIRAAGLTVHLFFL
jgi:hypothetical protein